VEGGVDLHGVEVHCAEGHRADGHRPGGSGTEVRRKERELLTGDYPQEIEP